MAKRKIKSEKTKKIKEKRKRRKNFFPTLVLIFFNWALVGLIVYFIEPDTFAIVPLFFVIIFFALLFTLATFFSNTKRGLIYCSFLTTFLILRSFGVGNLLNLLLLSGSAISIDYYLSRN